MNADHFVAHRGYPQKVTENTLASVQAAVDAGACYVEVDIQLTKDKEPVLFHDHTLHRLAGSRKAVHDLSWSALQELELLQSLRITHLTELVRYIQTTQSVTFFIEVKRSSIKAFDMQTVVDIILQALKPAKDQCVIISYSLETLQYVRQQSVFPIGVVIDDWVDRHRQAISSLKAEYLFCNLKSLPEQKPVKLDKSKLVVFDTEDPGIALDLIQRGVDLVETFTIGEMIKATAA